MHIFLLKGINMRVSQANNNFSVHKYQNTASKNTLGSVKSTAQSISFTSAIEYDANYNKAMLELVEDSNRYAYHQDNVDERKYILSKYNNSPVLYRRLALGDNVRYYGLERGKYSSEYANPHWEKYSAIDHVVHEGDLTGTYLLFEYAPNQATKDKLADALLSSYSAFLNQDIEHPVFYGEVYKHKEIKDFKDNPYVTIAALRHMSDEYKNENTGKIFGIFNKINENAHTLKRFDNIDKYHEFIKAGYEILNTLPPDTAKSMIKNLDKDMRPEYNKYIDELD